MAKFLIQSIDGIIKHDFSFALLEAINYQNWLNKGSHEFVLADESEMFLSDYSDYMPSGTVQFVQKFTATYHDKHKIKPINIPLPLRTYEFTKRFVTVSKKENILAPFDGFIKSNDQIKGITGIYKSNQIHTMSDGEYLLSSEIDIESEWRAFVYQDKLVGLQNYLGDFTMFPNIEFINHAIEKYKDSPPAYTLDVGINKEDGTFIIEVHNFFSCGTYGFSDNRILPQMVVRSFNHLLQKGY